MKKLYLLIVTLFMICPVVTNAQNVRIEMDKASTLMSESKYSEAYSLLQKITEKQAEEYSDTCAAYYNYYKGSCLYYMKKYEEAIPCLQKAFQIMDKIGYRNCDYFETLYGMGSSYKELGNYMKAEEFFRKVILKGNNIDIICSIRNQTYREMADLYIMMGKPNLADICTSRIESEIRLQGSKDLDSQIDGLWELYKAHFDTGKIEESINDLKKLRNLIEQNVGKNNTKYLSYSFILGSHLRYECNRPQEAAQIHKEMIDIGKQFKTHRDEICSAYIEYLRYLSENNNVDSIELILPIAVKYYFSTKDKRHEENLYETVGIGLCDAKNYDDGVKYLEKKWEGQSANSIKALNYLGNYYMYIKDVPAKALSYYNNAQNQINEGLEVPMESKITILENLVLCNQRLGNNEKAVSLHTILKPLIKSDLNYYSIFLIHWSYECLRAGDLDTVEELMKESESLLDHVSGNTQIQLYSNLGLVYIKKEKPDAAIGFIEKGIDLSIKEEGEKSKYLSTLYHNLGRAYMLKSDYSTALTALYKSKNLQLEQEGEVMQRTIDYINECESK